MVLPCPLYHCLGSVAGTMVCVLHGVTLILSSPSFNGKKALEAISREKWALVDRLPWAVKNSCSSLLGPDPFPKYCLSSLEPQDGVVREFQDPALSISACSPQL